MKLGPILVLVALLVPTVLWLVRGDGWDIVVRGVHVRQVPSQHRRSRGL